MFYIRNRCPFHAICLWSRPSWWQYENYLLMTSDNNRINSSILCWKRVTHILLNLSVGCFVLLHLFLYLRHYSIYRRPLLLFLIADVYSLSLTNLSLVKHAADTLRGREILFVFYSVCTSLPTLSLVLI